MALLQVCQVIIQIEPSTRLSLYLTNERIYRWKMVPCMRVVDMVVQTGYNVWYEAQILFTSVT